MRLQTANQAGGQDYFLAYCDVTDAVGQAVYIYGNKIGDLYQVRRTDTETRTKIPARGIIIEKLNGGAQCRVQRAGTVRNLPGYTSLTPQTSLHILPTAYLSQDPPEHPVVGIKIVQFVGYALTTNEFFLDLKPPIILVAN